VVREDEQKRGQEGKRKKGRMLQAEMSILPNLLKKKINGGRGNPARVGIPQKGTEERERSCQGKVNKSSARSRNLGPVHRRERTPGTRKKLIWTLRISQRAE